MLCKKIERCADWLGTDCRVCIYSKTNINTLLIKRDNNYITKLMGTIEI
jgi:hypothetical protein